MFFPAMGFLFSTVALMLFASFSILTRPDIQFSVPGLRIAMLGSVLGLVTFVFLSAPTDILGGDLLATLVSMFLGAQLSLLVLKDHLKTVPRKRLATETRVP